MVGGAHPAVLAAASTVAVPRTEAADSFRLHAPLELLARGALLARLGDDPAALDALERFVTQYRGDGTPLAPRAPLDASDADAACAALAGAVASGDVDAAGDAAAWLARQADATTLAALVAPLMLRSLAAAGHANIAFHLLAAHPDHPELRALLHPLAREVARNPTAQIDPLPPHSPASTDAIVAVLSDVPAVAQPASIFIWPLVDQAQHEPAIAARLARVSTPADLDDAARVLLRVAQWSMLNEPADFVPYGWTHGLTLPMGALAVGRLTGAMADAWQVAVTYVAAHRFGLGQRPLREPHGIPTGIDPLDLARRAAAHDDAHVVKYTVACLELAERDPAARDLHLAAADRLLRHWDI